MTPKDNPDIDKFEELVNVFRDQATARYSPKQYRKYKAAKQAVLDAFGNLEADFTDAKTYYKDVIKERDELKAAIRAVNTGHRYCLFCGSVRIGERVEPHKPDCIWTRCEP